jgi:hypothetical protein
MIGVSLLSFSGALVLYGYWWPSFQNMVEVTPVLALRDPTLYSRDFFIQERLGFGPRYVYLQLIYLLTLARLPIPVACFLLFAAAFTSFLSALSALARALSGSYLSAGVLAGIVLFGPLDTLGQAYLFRPESLPFVLAMGVSIWGLVFAMRERWVLAYLLFGLASLLQLLIGIMPALLLGIILVRRSLTRGDYGTLAACVGTFAVVLGASILPLIATGELGSTAFDSRGFVALYAFIRNPHHVVPSYFLRSDWLNWGAFWVTGVIAVWSLTDVSAERKWDLTLALGVVPICILVNYVFVEIVPSAMVAKLQLARITPFGKLVAALALALLIEQQIKAGKAVAGVGLLLLALVERSAVPLLGATATLAMLVRKKRDHLLRGSAALIGMLGVAALCICYDPAQSLAPHLRTGFAAKLIGTAFLLLPYGVSGLRSQPRTLNLIGLLSAAVTIYIVLAIANGVDDPIAQAIQSRLPLSSLAYYQNFEATAVAEQFAALSPVNALILVPPSRFEFRFFSRRSVVFDFFAFPFAEPAMREWLERLESMTGATPAESLAAGKKAPWEDLDQLYRGLSSRDLLAIARRFGAEYVLTQDTWHPDFPGQVLFRLGTWVVYVITPS